MKRRLVKLAAVAALFLAIGWMTGCTATTNPPTAPPVVGAGYVDQYDQQFAQDIAAAETFYRDQQNNINARTYVPTPTELTALNALGIAINVAKGAAKQYKAAQTAANLTAAQNAVGSAKSQSQALQTQIGGK